ncbi:MAG: pyruvate kinase [Myxococcota bacterium]
MAIQGFVKTKIVATIGPSTQSSERLRDLIDAGVDVFRLNMSHMDHDTADTVIGRIRKLSNRVAVLVDLQGPKMRLSDVAEPFVVDEGEQLRLRGGDALGTREVLYVPMAELVAVLRPGHRVLIDDGKIQLRVRERVGDAEVVAVVEAPGRIKGRKGIAAPEARFVPSTYLDEQDLADLEFARRRKVDFLGASYVSQGSDVADVRQSLGEDAERIDVIAKIESRVGVDNSEEIVAMADGIMVARGDLGVEIPPEEVPIVQKRLIRLCNEASRPVIVATQMLDSMIHSPVASRAETSDVANAILDGTDAVMLSAETSVGDYPIEAVRTLDRISAFVEAEVPANHEDILRRPSTDTVEFICKSAARAALEMDIKALVTFTNSGFTARHVSAYRPNVPILATTPDDSIVRRLALQYGVFCIQAEHIGRYDVMLHRNLDKLCRKELLSPEDLVAVAGGVPTGVPGSTNMLQVGTVGQLMSGEG